MSELPWRNKLHRGYDPPSRPASATRLGSLANRVAVQITPANADAQVTESTAADILFTTGTRTPKRAEAFEDINDG